MSFLDNRGDIILDCVLTDYGRKLLARGDGSFNIVKFAFGDDEIDYSLFATGSETALQDVNIMNTPVLEAFTNNAASMKSKLLSIVNKNYLYLPIMKSYLGDAAANTGSFFAGAAFNGWAVSVDTAAVATYSALTQSNTGKEQGILGVTADKDHYIRIDQGIDSSLTNTLEKVSPELSETEYNIIIDSRFGTIVSVSGDTQKTSAVDDDMMATYKFTLNGDVDLVKELDATTSTKTGIKGKRGTSLQFSIRPTEQMSSDSIYSKYGTTASGTGGNFKIIKTVVKVVGSNTGYSVDLPVVFVKKA